ncbi:hypothetical protein D3C78_1773140 [compost metagenome]
MPLAQPRVPHRLYRTNWRSRHQNIERLLLTFGGISDFLLLIHPAESKPALMANIPRGENTGQGLCGWTL